MKAKNAFQMILSGRSPKVESDLSNLSKDHRAIHFSVLKSNRCLLIRLSASSDRVIPEIAEWGVTFDLRASAKALAVIVGGKLAAATTMYGIQGSRVVVNVPDLVWRKQLVRDGPNCWRRMNEPWPTPWITEIAFTHEN